MGNKNSTTPQGQHGTQGARVGTTEPHRVSPNPRKVSTKRVGLGAHPHGEKAKPLGNDDTFSTYIKNTKHKMKSNKSNVGGHEEQSNPVPLDVADGTHDNRENEKDHFSEFIHNARKKLRTLTRRNSSFKRGVLPKI
ncbi:hypothetical protein CR513_00029, partial [Mucuna pruriens]